MISGTARLLAVVIFLTCNSYGGAGLWWSICLAMASHTLDAELTTAVTCKYVRVIST